MNNTTLIHCEQLFACENNKKSVLNLNAKAGEIISIIGPDCEQKSEWLKTLAGVIQAESGQIYLSGKNTLQFGRNDWVKIRREFAYVHANSAVLSAANAMQNLMLPVMYHKLAEPEELRARAEQLLQQIDAGENLEQLPAYLTKEQRYKIVVARCLMLKPKALFLNSPFTALELNSVNPFKQFLRDLVSTENLLLILATHDMQFALAYSDQIIYVSEQQLLQFDKTQRIENCDIQEVRNYLAL